MDTILNQQQQQPGIQGGKGRVREGGRKDERKYDESREKSESEQKLERFGCEDFRKHPNLEVQRVLKQNGYHKFTLKDQNNNINKSETDNVNRDISENVLWLKYSFGQHS